MFLVVFHLKKSIIKGRICWILWIRWAAWRKLHISLILNNNLWTSIFWAGGREPYPWRSANNRASWFMIKRWPFVAKNFVVYERGPLNKLLERASSWYSLILFESSGWHIQVQEYFCLIVLTLLNNSISVQYEIFQESARDHR
jgi:hypothetical protein